MRLLTIISMSLFSFFTVCINSQQAFTTSQYMFNLLNINPAYAGSKDYINANISHRSQWVGFEGAPSTQNITVHGPIKRLNIGLGLQVTNDVIGPRQMNAIKTAYAYHLKLGKGNLGFGLRGGIINYSYNWDDLNYEDNTDAVIGIGKENGLLADFDFGTYYQDRLQYIGLEIAHLASPKISRDAITFNQIPQINAFYGRAFEISEKTALKSSLLFSATEASNFLDVNLSVFLLKKYWLGVTYRTSGAIVAIADVSITPKLRLGYAYDYILSKLSTVQSGSHEIFIGYDFNLYKNQNLSPRYF